MQSSRRTDDLRQQARRERGQRRDAHRAASTGAHRVRVGDDGVQIVKRSLERRKQLAANARELDRAAASIEHPDLERALEVADLDGERGLREVQGFGGPREASEVRHGHEGACMAKVHIHVDLVSLESDYFNGVIRFPFRSSALGSSTGAPARGLPRPRARRTGRRRAVNCRLIRAALAASSLALISALPAQARVTRIVVDQTVSPAYSGQSFGTVGSYEQLRGRIFGELDPSDPRNALIQDIQLAPRNGAGRVEYISSFTLLKPIDMSRGNRGLLHDMVN